MGWLSAFINVKQKERFSEYAWDCQELRRKYFKLGLDEDCFRWIEKKYLKEIESIIGQGKLGNAGDL